MKTTSKLIISIFTLLALTTSVHAQSPREQLQQMVQQLQKTPNDNALREKIIKLAPKLKPAPALPSEAERRMARGSAAFKGAASVADYQEAAKEFEQATLAAPWYGDAYYNLGVAQDKAEDYDEALRSLKLAALASPGSKDAEKLSYAVEFRKEKAAGPEARAAKQKLKDEALMKNIEGAVFTRMWTPDLENQFRISNGRAVFWTRKLASNVCTCSDEHRCNGPTGEEGMCDYTIPLDGRRGERRNPNGGSATIEIAEDGQSLLLREIWRSGSTPTDYVYKRR